jgi:glycosyltransferase involved in cell wall biosynthesis
MHLVIVNQYGLPAGAPGITRHGDLGAELVRRGHTVTVIASRFNYLTRSDEDAAGAPVEVHDGVRFRWLDTGVYAGNDRRRLRSMVSFTLRSIVVGWGIRPRPDVVMASSPHLLVAISGALLARRHRVPFVFEVRDLWPSALVDLGAIRRGGLVHRALSLVERFGYRAADRIVIVPPHADRRVRELGTDPRRCVHIPNAVSTDDRAAAASPVPASLAATFEACAGRTILLYTGAQGVSNGLDVVLDALDLLRSTEPSTYDGLAVVLVGDGGDHDRLVRDAAARGHANVRFHPPIPKSSIPDALARADLLLVAFADAPVYDYGLSPNKLFDYLAAGRPVLLASRLTDTAVDAARAGRTYVPGSGASLATAIVELLGVPASERAAMGERGRAYVAEHHTLDRTGGLLEATLRDLVSGTAS